MISPLFGSNPVPPVEASTAGFGAAATAVEPEDLGLDPEDLGRAPEEDVAEEVEPPRPMTAPTMPPEPQPWFEYGSPKVTAAYRLVSVM
jgi:hypothetical protein